MTEEYMTEEERRAGVYVEPHLDFHDRGCAKRYGVESNQLCECEQRASSLNSDAL
jgi:hypothetical protein